MTDSGNRDILSELFAETPPWEIAMCIANNMYRNPSLFGISSSNFPPKWDDYKKHIIENKSVNISERELADTLKKMKEVYRLAFWNDDWERLITEG